MNDKTVSAGQNQEAGQNLKAEQDSGEVFFQEAALFRAETYGKMLDDRVQLKALIDAGVIPYTEEMAIRDLSAVSVGYDTERVQTSNISNIPERIAALLDSGYVEKMNRRQGLHISLLEGRNRGNRYEGADEQKRTGYF